MGLYCSFDVIEDFGYQDAIEVEGEEFIPDYSAGCETFVEVFLQVATDLVPVDTGYLQSTITATCDETSCECETICEYAEYQEYGTWCCEAQPYFEPALERALEAAAPLWDNALAEAISDAEAYAEDLEAEAEEEEMAMGSEEGFGVMGFLAGMFMAILVAAFVTLVTEFIKDTFGSDSGRGGVGGEYGSVYVPEIEII